MAGAEETGEIGGEDEMSEDGSVDLENESDDELEEDVELDDKEEPVAADSALPDAGVRPEELEPASEESLVSR